VNSIVIIDYGMGNVGSILNMYKRIGVTDVQMSGKPEVINKADKLILPGVGAFDNGMKHLRESGLIEVLNNKVLKQKTLVLGICLGMQLLTKESEEGAASGLGWIDAETVKFSFQDNQLKIPHMGWDYIKVNHPNPLIEQEGKKRFYFVHSYYVKCNDDRDILATADYGFEFTCAVHRENIFGTQFHPEKSHKFGMHLLENFAKL